MKHSLFQKDILSLNDLSLEQIESILNLAEKFKQKPAANLLNQKIIAHCFFEPSTRTRLSFESATLRLGGNVIGFSNQENLSTQKGESLSDTIRMISAYSDLIILRHAKEGAARLAAAISDKPVINAGDGANQHPSQTLLDLFAIRESQQRLQGLSIAFVGDLKYGRTVHSLLQACKLLKTRLFFVAPDSLNLSQTLCDELKKDGIRFSFHQTIEEIIPKVDILYMTRIQKERFSDIDYERIKNQFILREKMLSNAKSNLKILHPLPRVNEIEPGIDETPFAYYFQQAANGVFVRQALLALVMHEKMNEETSL